MGFKKRPWRPSRIRAGYTRPAYPKRKRVTVPSRGVCSRCGHGGKHVHTTRGVWVKVGQGFVRCPKKSRRAPLKGRRRPNPRKPVNVKRNRRDRARRALRQAADRLDDRQALVRAIEAAAHWLANLH